MRLSYLVGPAFVVLVLYGLGWMAIGAAEPDGPVDLTAQFDTCARMPEHPIDIPYDRKLVEACTSVLAAGYRSADAHFYLGRHFVLSHQEIEKAVYHLRRGAAMGNAKATTGLGYLHETHQYKWELSTALDYYLEAADFGDVRGMVLAAVLSQVVLADAAGVERKSLRLLKQAAEAGDPYGYFFLAEFLRVSGKEVPRDRKKAIYYYRQAAQAGVSEAVKMLKLLEEDTSTYQGMEMKYDWTHPKAVAFYRK